MDAMVWCRFHPSFSSPPPHRLLGFPPRLRFQCELRGLCRCVFCASLGFLLAPLNHCFAVQSLRVLSVEAFSDRRKEARPVRIFGFRGDERFARVRDLLHLNMGWRVMKWGEGLDKKK